MKLEIRPMTIEDYHAVVDLWKVSEGVGLSNADSPEAIGRYLARNPDLSQTVWADTDGKDNPVILAGAVLCGHDGRRGLLHHLAIHPEYRRKGLGRMLVQRCLQGLHDEGIDKCHLFVFNNNRSGRDFWLSLGWYERPELVLMSVDC